MTEFLLGQRARRAMVPRGFVGSVLLLLGALIGNDLPPSRLHFLVDPLQWLGVSPIGHPVTLTLTLAGLLCLSWSWVQLVTMSRDDSETRRLALVRRAACWWVLPLLISPPLFSNDGWSYVAQGALAAAGNNPYEFSPGEMPELLTSMVDPIWRYTTTPYGPVPLVWGGACAELVRDPSLLLLLHRVPAVLGLGLTAWAVPRLARRIHVDAAVASALAIASPFVMAHAVGGLHNDALAMGLVAVALVVGTRHHWVLGAALVGAAAGIKVTGIVALVPVILVSLPSSVHLLGRVSRLAVGGVVAASVVAVAGIPYGLGVGWLKALGVPGVVVTPSSLPTAVGLGLDWVLTRTGSPSASYAVPFVRVLGMALAVAVVLVLALTRPCGDVRSAVRTMIGVLLPVVVLAPVVQSWYLLTLVPCVALLSTRGGRMRAALLAGVVMGLTAALDSRMAGASALIAAACVVVLALRTWPRERRRARLRAALENPSRSSALRG